jgi:imidazolonepropionase-like amidohydrolase
VSLRTNLQTLIAPLLACVFACHHAHAQIAVKAKTIHTMNGAPITDGIVLIRDGKIAQVGRAADIAVPEGFRVIEAAVATPGLIDARSTVGLSGIYNTPHDQDQLERSSPIQPELRAIDAYNWSAARPAS